nr:transglutaminase family protein [Pseudomonas sp. GX19020]
MTQAWELFGNVAPGWSRVRAIFDYVNRHLTFGYEHARPTRTASEAWRERVGVCRDFAHLAITLCRCMNIPARYANGYLGDIGVAPNPAPMDFNAWCEVWLEDRWFTLDARHNEPRIGRVVIARGRDATDIPLIHSFGPHQLTKFRVWTEEAKDAAAPEASSSGQTGS